MDKANSQVEVNLRPHGLRIALLQPQIAPNTGNIGRLCVATGTQLHLVRPMGFVLSDRNLRRSVMDYWPRLQLTIHDDSEAFFRHVGAVNPADRRWFFTTKAKQSLWEAKFAEGDWLIFGSETAGIEQKYLEANPETCLRIPQMEGERCLNLSTSAGIGLYEALRQIGKLHKT